MHRGLPILGGVQLHENISDSKNERKSRNYYLSKEYKLSAGLVDPKLLKISDTCPETFSAIEMDYKFLDQRTQNMIPIYLDSESGFSNHRHIFVDGTFSVCKNVEFNESTFLAFVSIIQQIQKFFHTHF
jgi:hypothetical protein